MNQAMSNSETETQTPIADKARQFAPVVWLLGKVQSGKTSIIRELTQAGDAEIGSGFRACTQTARVFDFPDEAPIIRFLDTRGLGEVAYDPAEDIGFCEGRSHLILAVVKALDLEQQAVLDVIRAAQAAPSGMAGGGGADEPARGLRAGRAARAALSVRVDASGGRRAGRPSGACARASARAVPGAAGRGCAEPSCRSTSRKPGDGFEPADYGREALIDALIAAAPAAVAAALAELPQRARRRRRAQGQRPHPRASRWRPAPAMPFPLAGVVAVPMVQAAMLRQLAKLYGVTLGQAGLRRVRRRARHRHAGADRLDLRRAPARQADPGLRADGRCRRGRGRELRRHLRHGQGRQLLPGHAPAGRGRATRSPPSTARRCGRPSAWRRSATSAPARREQSRDRAEQADAAIRGCVLLAVALLLPAAEPHPARQPLAVAARLHPLLGARHLRRRRRPSTTCRGA